MKVIDTKLNGVKIIENFYAEDLRGSFLKDYNEETFGKMGVPYHLKETFYTISKRGVVRAIHFQEEVPQPKLVQCLSGKIYDVVVDLDPKSSTYKEWIGIELSSDEPISLLIPGKCGHGYIVIEDSIVSYKCGEGFHPEGDSGIYYLDKDLKIDWKLEEYGIKEVLLSEKDKNLQSFKEFASKTV